MKRFRSMKILPDISPLKRAYGEFSKSFLTRKTFCKAGFRDRAYSQISSKNEIFIFKKAKNQFQLDNFRTKFEMLQYFNAYKLC